MYTTLEGRPYVDPGRLGRHRLVGPLAQGFPVLHLQLAGELIEVFQFDQSFGGDRHFAVGARQVEMVNYVA